MLQKLELSEKTHRELVEYCHKKEIQFLSTAFDEESIHFLVNDLGLSTLKIPSGELTNGPLLLKFGQTGCDLILSTGMATLGEIEEALSVIAFGLMNGTDSSALPSRAAFLSGYASQDGQQLLREKVTLLHCTTEYPAPMQDINLNAIKTLKRSFGLKVGFSDHSQGTVPPIAAVAIGASIIEKHFTLDKKLPGPDHRASLEPDDLYDMVAAVRTVEKIMGDGIKRPMPPELANRPVARKSLVANTAIKKGEIFNENNIAIKRPGTGRSPMEYWDLMSQKSTRNCQPDDIIN